MRYSRKNMFVFCTVIILYFSFIISARATSDEFTVGDFVEFGSYPQTLVTDETLIQELGNQQALSYEEEQYSAEFVNSRTIRFVEGNITGYKEVVYNGEKYRGVYIYRYKPSRTDTETGMENSYQDNNGYTSQKWYWFKYEPLKWRIFDKDGLALCVSIIDAQAFCNSYQNQIDEDGYTEYVVYDNGRMPYASSYGSSHVDKWLNTNFLNSAFTVQEQEFLPIVTVDTSVLGSAYQDASKKSVATDAKVVLLTHKQSASGEFNELNEYIVKDEFSNSHTEDIVSDYAKIQGVYKEKPIWWLATPGEGSNLVWAIQTSKSTDEFRKDTTYYSGHVLLVNGIRPVISVAGIKSTNQNEITNEYQNSDIKTSEENSTANGTTNGATTETKGLKIALGALASLAIVGGSMAIIKKKKG